TGDEWGIAEAYRLMGRSAQAMGHYELAQRHLESARIRFETIGDRLHLSPRTIEKHVSSLFRKTESSNRAELVRFAMEHHLVGNW
ncbi:MAG: response regulator transcription factor, partial [Microcoleus sp.]